MARKGFTLVELIISLIILSIFLGGVLYSFKVDLNYWERIVGRCEKEQISGFVLAAIVRDVRAAKAVLPGSGHDTLQLQVGADTIEYSIANNKVKRQKNGYSSYLTDVGEISKLHFSFAGPGLVIVTIEDLSASVYLRN